MLLAAFVAGCGGLGQRDLVQAEAQKNWRLLVYDGKHNYYLRLSSKSLEGLGLSSGDSLEDFASLHPDGNSLVFAKNWGEGVRALISQVFKSKHESVVANMPYLLCPRWSPRGSEIAFQGKAKDAEAYSLFVLQASDGKPITIVDSEIPSGSCLFSWAPDGKRLAFQSTENKIWLVELATKHRRLVDSGWFPSWSPDGRYLTYRVDAKDPNPGYIIYDLHSGVKKSLLVGQAVYRTLVWSPDSRYLAYSKSGVSLSRLLGGESHNEVFVMEVATQGETRIYSHDRSLYPSDWAVARLP